MKSKKMRVLQQNFLKYTLHKREVRNWFILPQDSDHWVHQDRRSKMMTRIADCAKQNGFAGVQVFHPNGVHLETVTCLSDNGFEIRFCTEKGGVEMEDQIGDVSFEGQSNAMFMARNPDYKNLPWRRHNLLPLDHPMNRG
jgi:hypothetical protein